MKTNLPARFVEDQTWFTVRNRQNPTEQLVIVAPTETEATALALDKIGYVVYAHDGKYFMCDADDTSIIESQIDARTAAEAVNKSLTAVGWYIDSGMEMKGGACRYTALDTDS